MVVIPNFRGYEYVLSPDRACLESCLYSHPNLFLIPITFGTVDMPKSDFQRVNNCLRCDCGIFPCERCTKSSGRHLPSSAKKSEFCVTKSIVRHNFSRHLASDT